MKISIVLWALTTTPRGMERVGAMLANHLAAHGHTVEILVFDPQNRPPIFKLHKSITIFYMPHLSQLSAQEATRKHLVNKNTDVVIAMFSWFAMLYFPIMLKGSNIPLIISEHNSPDIIIHRWNQNERLAAMAGADIIHLLMPEFIHSLPKYLQERVQIFPNPVEPAEKLASPGKTIRGKKTLLVVSSLHEETKNISALIDAFKILKGKFPDWRLKFWGGGPDEEIVTQKISAAGLQNSFLLCGHTDNINREYESANLFCLSSKYEGCPCALQEAQAHGLPAVGYADCPGVNQLIIDGQNGFLADEMTAESLAQSLSRLMADQHMRIQFGASAFENSKKYRPHNIFKKWEHCIAQATRFKGQTALSVIPSSTEIHKHLEDLDRFRHRTPIATPNDSHRENGPKVSVIIPVFNVEKYLDQCLQSVLAQTLEDIEIICVDDASVDKSHQILKRYADKDKRLRVLKHDHNRGLPAARNTGFDVSRGDFITFIDSDDFYVTDLSLEILYLRAIEDRADETIGGVLKWDEDSNHQFRDWHRNYLGEDARGQPLENLPELWSNVVAWNKLIRRSILVQNNIRFNEEITKHEDHPFSVKVHTYSKRISIVTQTTYIYRQVKSGSIMSTKKKDDVYHRAAYCHEIFKFIESESNRHRYREIFYPMYSEHVVNCIESISEFDYSDQEIKEIFAKLKNIIDLLPNELPAIPTKRHLLFNYIKHEKVTESIEMVSKMTNDYNPNDLGLTTKASRNFDQIRKLEDELDNLQSLNTLLSNQIEAVYQSSSWRITAPLRLTKKLLSRIRPI